MQLSGWVWRKKPTTLQPIRSASSSAVLYQLLLNLPVQDENQKQNLPAETGKGDIRNLMLEVLGVKGVKNSDNEDVAIINVDFTNITNDEAANYRTTIVTEFIKMEYNFKQLPLTEINMI